MGVVGVVAGGVVVPVETPAKTFFSASSRVFSNATLSLPYTASTFCSTGTWRRGP
ncbi:hypothetical protein ACFSUJ_35050 [Streptomyces lusitanus]|uniref:hypothetical protein n=1 Tax=Streptomyces lusitanus TaxID=68232 RepID=UPI00362B74EF